MKKWKTVFAMSGVTLALFAICGVAHLRESSHRDEISPQLDKAVFAQKTQKLQMPFIANNGQVDEQVEFYAKTFGGTVFVTKNGEIVYALPKTEKAECRLGEAERTQQAANPQSKNPSDSSNPKSAIQNLSSTSIEDPKSGIALREEFVGARVKTIQGEDPSVTKVNYFKGSDPSKWKTNVSTYDAVSLGDVYDGIELKLKAYGNNVEKLFCVKPKSNPDQIKVHLSGAKSIVVNEEGQLVAETELGPVKFTKPVAYQEINGKQVDVSVEYRIQKSELNPKSTIQNVDAEISNPKSAIHNPQSEYGFKVASYDHTQPLIIDPLLASTYLGSDAYDELSLTLDTSGNVYVTGSTGSTDFPTTSGAYDTSYYDGYDVFVSKLDGGLTSLLASTFMGGWDSDFGNSLTLDASGNVYVAGYTYSTDFPTTSGAYNTSSNGSNDAFVSKLDGGLTSLLASTYLGGSNGEWGYSLTLDASGNVYVTGQTYSTDFPTTSGAYDTSYNGGGGEYDHDVFVAKLDSGLTSLLASTYLGGPSSDEGYSLALDTSGNVYVTGSTNSKDFPTTSGAYDTSYNGSDNDSDDGSDYDVFVSKLNSGLTSLLASTYLGGSGYDWGISLALDTSGNVYVTGMTGSKKFPTTSGAYDTSYNGGNYDVFVSKLNSGLTRLLASTFLGGSDGEWGSSLTLDASGNVYLTGGTGSKDFPTTSGAYDTSYNGGGDDYNEDVFVSKLDGGLTRLLASTYMGGPSSDEGDSLTLDTSGNVYVTGITGSKKFPTTSGAYDTSYNSSGKYDYDVFVSKLDSDLSAGSGKGMIYGFVADTSGNAIESAKVTLAGKNGKKEKTTDNTGSFEFTGLDAGTYKVTAKKKGYKTTGKTVKLKKGEEKRITITMKAGK